MIEDASRREFLKGLATGAVGGGATAYLLTKRDKQAQGPEEMQIDMDQLSEKVGVEKGVSDTLEKIKANVSLDASTGHLRVLGLDGNVRYEGPENLGAILSVSVIRPFSGQGLEFHYLYKDGTDQTVTVARDITSGDFVVNQQASSFEDQK